MLYDYQAIDARGKQVKGVLEAASPRDVMAVLKQQGCIPVAITAKSGALAKAGGTRAGKSLSPQQKLLFMRELATLLRAGVAMAAAVESMAEAHQGTEQGTLASALLKGLRAGESLSSALAASKADFPGYALQLMQAGELTGKLAASLHGAADQMEADLRLASDVKSAMIYPLVLVSSGIGAVLLIFIFVVPRFANLLRNPKADLPWISSVVLKAGLLVKQQLPWVVLIVATLVTAVVVVLRRPAVRLALMERLAVVPLLGRWVIETQIGQWAGMLSTLLENKVPIIRALELSSSGVALPSLRRQLEIAVREVKSGKSLADALRQHQTASATDINLIRVGERTGELAGTLKTVATLYSDSSKVRLKRFMVLLEPVAILCIGAIIGVVMVAIMLAITSLNNVVR